MECLCYFRDGLMYSCGGLFYCCGGLVSVCGGMIYVWRGLVQCVWYFMFHDWWFGFGVGIVWFVFWWVCVM